MGFISDFLLFIKLKRNSNISWPELSSYEYVRGRLATFDDYREGKASFFSVSGTQNIPIESIIIPQYAYVVRNRFIKIPCVLIQAEGIDERKFLVGYRNLITNENEVAWCDQIEYLGKRSNDSL